MSNKHPVVAVTGSSGAGTTTVITRGKEAVTKLRQPAKKGDRAISVESADGFRVGDEFFLRDLAVAVGVDLGKAGLPQRLEVAGVDLAAAIGIEDDS